MPTFAETMRDEMERLTVGVSTKPPRKEDSPVAPGFTPVTVVEQPVKVTRNLTFTIVGISVAVSVVIDGFIRLVLG